MSTEQLAAAIAILRIGYPGEFTDETVAFYARRLSSLDPAEVVAAVDRLTNRMRFRPTVADIRLEVAEAQLGLPDFPEAWAIAQSGDLRGAPEPVREAAAFVGGRWGIMTTENPATVRAQFRQAYERTREQALLEAAGASATTHRSLSPASRPALPPADLDTIEGHVVPMPLVLQWQLAIARGEDVEPNDAVKHDAIRILSRGPWTGDPETDMLYRAAELVLVHANDQGGTTT